MVLKTRFWKRITGWQPFINELNTMYIGISTMIIIFGNNTARGLASLIIITSGLQKLSYRKYMKEKEISLK